MSVARQRGSLVTNPPPVHVVGRAIEVPPTATPTPPRHSATQRRLKRGIDVALASVGLLLGVIPGLIIALFVKATSRGPVLFVQERVGVGGRRFRVYKFRTMLDGTHAAVLADDALRKRYELNGFKLSPDDPKITAVGRFLRKTSLDELPQVLNVARGDMSVVGVRPLVEVELALRDPYDQELYRSMRPGLTGLWQVEGRSSVTIAERVELDRAYAENWSISGDLRILARTPVAVLRVSQAH